MRDSMRFSIKEFSEITDLNESTLRYYDKIGLFTPELRGENNYRYYSPLQAIMADYIKILIRVGVPLSKIVELAQNKSPQNSLNLLLQQESKLDMQLYEIQSMYSLIHTYRTNIDTALRMANVETSVMELSESRLILGPVNDFECSPSFVGPFKEFCRSAREHNIDLHYPIGGYHPDMASFFRAPSQPVRFFSLDPRGNSSRPAGKYLVAHHRGYYGDFGDCPQKMAAYAEATGLTFSGPLYVIYLLDEFCMDNPEEYLAQITVGVSQNQKAAMA